MRHDHGATRVFNVTFHGLGEPGRAIAGDETRYWMGVEAFELVLGRVAQWPEARITLDDGNLSDLTVAVPRLVKRGLRGRFFVLAGRVGKAGYMGRGELRELLAAGMEIGSHGMEHRSWRGLAGEALAQEIGGAKAMLEDLLGVAITQAACPFGEYGRRALAALAGAGFTRVYTSDRGWARGESWLQARNTITGATDIGAVERVRAWPWPKRLLHAGKLILKRWR